MNIAPRIQSYCCPACGGFIGEAAPIGDVLDSMMDSHRKIILSVLSKKPGRIVDKNRLIEAVYGDRADGGPDSTDSAINVHLHRLRKDLSAFGWSIICIGRNSGDFGHGGSYKLMPMEVSA